MARTARRTATFDAEVIERANRVRRSRGYRQALIDLAGHDPQTESALFNDLAKIALDVVERRAMEAGYRQLAKNQHAAARDVEQFLDDAALASFDYESDEDPSDLLTFLARQDG
jgi:hypothetical protein